MVTSKIRRLLGKITNVGLIVLGFVSVFFASHAKDHVVDSHEALYGTSIAHADVPAGYGGGSTSGDASGSGSGGCGAGCGGSSGGDGGGASGCGCGSY